MSSGPGAACAQELGRVDCCSAQAPIATGDGKAFNRSFLFDDNGKIAARYDKIHMFDVTLGGTENYRESDGFEAGTARGGCRRADAREARLDHLLRCSLPATSIARSAKAGAEIIAVPAAFTVPTGHGALGDAAARTRDRERRVRRRAGAGRHARGRARTWGHSVIIDPSGQGDRQARSRRAGLHRR